MQNNMINAENVDGEVAPNTKIIINKKRNDKRNLEETYDSNKLDPEFLQ